MSSSPESGNSVIVTWPREADGPWRGLLRNAETGYDYSMATVSLSVNLSPRGTLTAEAVMMTDETGAPLPNGQPVQLSEDGLGYRTDTFRFTVTHMRMEG